MKKIALVLLALAITFPLVAGDLDGATVSISGDATTAFGINLDTNATGFVNTLNAKLKINFGLGTTATGSGMEAGAIYGEVLFDEIAITTIENNNADLNGKDLSYGMLEMDIDLEYAKLIGPNWWISFKAQDDTIDYENASQNGIIGIAAAWDGQMDNTKNDLTSSGGFEAGLDLGVAEIQLSAFSLTDWNDTSADMNAYGVKAEVILSAIDNLTVKAAINTGINASATTTLNDDLGFGGLLSYAIMVSDDITITPEVGADIHMLDGGGMDMAIGNGLRVTLAGAEITAAEDGVVDVDGDSYAWDDGVNSGLTLGWSYYMPNVGASALGIQAHLGVSMIENFQLALGFEAADLLNDGAMGLAVYTDYTMGMAMPYLGLFYEIDGATIIDAGLVLTDIFPHFSMAVRYNSGDLAAATPALGVAKIEAKVSY
jgi:hypothetical protein